MYLLPVPYLVTTVPRSRSPMVCSRSERPPRWNTGELSNILPPGFTSAPCTSLVSVVRIPDPVPFRPPGSGMIKKSRSGSYFRELRNNFWGFKILWCGSGIRNLFDPGSGMEKIRNMEHYKKYLMIPKGLRPYKKHLLKMSNRVDHLTETNKGVTKSDHGLHNYIFTVQC